jgi:outer membrane lipoprotein SlyB
MEAKLYEQDPAGAPQRTSALALGVAVAVIILSAIAIGAATGVIPRSSGQDGGRATHVPLASIQPADSSCVSCGTVASIRAVQLRDDPAADDGRGTAASILSAAGGIFGGQDFQRSSARRYSYRVTLRMDDGSYRTVSESAPPRFGIGQKVKLIDGTLAANS